MNAAVLHLPETHRHQRQVSPFCTMKRLPVLTLVTCYYPLNGPVPSGSLVRAVREEHTSALATIQ